MKRREKSKSIHKKNPTIRFNKKILLFLLLFVFIILVTLFIKKSTQNTITPQPTTTFQQKTDVEPTPNLGNTFEKGHKIAYLRVDNVSFRWMSVWVYDLDTETEKQVVPEINQSVICPGDSCPNRSFSFSTDGTKLAVDLVSNGSEIGFGIVDVTSQNPNFRYISKGYSPSFAYDNNGLFFYDKNYNTPVLSYKDLKTNAITTIGNYTIVGWLSDKMAVLNSNDYNKEQIGIFYTLNLDTFDIKTIKIDELANQKKRIHALKVSPDKNKILISYTQKPGKPAVGIISPDGSFLSVLSFPTPPVGNPDYLTNYGNLIDASWSPDGKFVAIQVHSAYRDLPSNVNIYDAKSTKLVRQTSIEDFLYGGGCWIPSSKGEIVVSILDSSKDEGSHHVIQLYNLKTGEKKILDLAVSGMGDSVVCY